MQSISFALASVFRAGRGRRSARPHANEGSFLGFLPRQPIEHGAPARDPSPSAVGHCPQQLACEQPAVEAKTDSNWASQGARSRVNRPLRVLLADDSVLCQIEVEKLLEPLDVVLEIAGDGSQAVERFMLAPFDLVLMDIDMPVVDGVAAMRSIRGVERLRGLRPTRIAILSGRSAADMQAVAKEVAVCAHITKPFDPAAILSLVETVAAELAE